MPKRANMLVWAVCGAILLMLNQLLNPGPWADRPLVGLIAQGLGGAFFGAIAAAIRNAFAGPKRLK